MPAIWYLWLSCNREGKFVFLICQKRSQRPRVPGGVLEGLMQKAVAWGTAWLGAQHPQGGCTNSPPPTRPAAAAPAAPHRPRPGGAQELKASCMTATATHRYTSRWVTELKKQIVQYGINTLHVLVMFLHQIYRSVSESAVWDKFYTAGRKHG